jgi:hypothetical protein
MNISGRTARSAEIFAVNAGRLGLLGISLNGRATAYFSDVSPVRMVARPILPGMVAAVLISGSADRAGRGAPYGSVKLREHLAFPCNRQNSNRGLAGFHDEIGAAIARLGLNIALTV